MTASAVRDGDWASAGHGGRDHEPGAVTELPIFSVPSFATPCNGSPPALRSRARVLRVEPRRATILVKAPVAQPPSAGIAEPPFTPKGGGPQEHSPPRRGCHMGPTGQSGGARETFTVRRIVQGGGVERTFPLHSPKIERVMVLRSGKVRRAKLYYLRKRIGTQATRVEEERSLAAGEPAQENA